MEKQAVLFTPGEVQEATGRCPDCGKRVEPLFGAVQRALVPGVVEVHATCLARRQERERKGATA